MVIPVYNKGPHIQRSISSVLNQSYQDFELIIVNDASTDNSLEEIMKFNDSRIRVLHRDTPGPGGYAARNLGIQEARADWIAFLDADDEWMPRHLQAVQELVTADRCKCVAQGWIDVAQGTEQLFQASRYVRSTAHFSFESFLSIGRRGHSLFHMNSVAVYRTLLLSIGGFPAGTCRRGGDVATWLKVVCEAGGVLMSPEPGARYFRDDSFVTKTIAPETKLNCVVLGAQRLLNENKLDTREKRLLKQFSNAHLRFGLVRRAVEGRLTIKDLRSLYGRANPFQYSFFCLMAILPDSVQASLWRWYQALKALTR